MTNATTPRGLIVNLRLAGRRCVVVGSDAEAAHRARLLTEAGARVIVSGPCDAPELAELRAEDQVELTDRPFVAEDLDGAWLVVATAHDASVCAAVAREAERRQVFCCVLDAPASSSFFNVARARSGPMTLAVASEGRIPALVRRLREELQRLMDEADLGAFAEELATLREQTPRDRRASVLGQAVQRLKLEGRLIITRRP